MEHIYILKYRLTFFLLMFLLLGASMFAQGELIPFTKIYPDEVAGDPPSIRGDMKVIGNSILGVQDEINRTDYEPNDPFDVVTNNNRVTRGYIDIDDDPAFNGIFNAGLPSTETEYQGSMNEFGSPTNPTFGENGTFSSSAAELVINDEDLTCSVVKKAFLYWGALYPAETLELRNNDDVTVLEKPECNNCEFYTDIKILPPNATEYIDIKHENSGDDYTSLKSSVIFDGDEDSFYAFSDDETITNSPYVCVADVTSLFTYLQGEGESVEGNWTVGNVRATTGTKSSGSGGGWSLVIIYEDPLAIYQKNISLFEGYVAISGGDEPSIFNITGFETIPNGDVNVDLATIALEGDTSLTGDQFQILEQGGNAANDNDWVSLSFPTATANNFYDSSIYSKGEVIRYPSSENNLGYDSDHFNMENGGNRYIENSDTEADFRIFTNSDTYGNFFNGFAIEVIAPELDVIKRVFREDDSEFAVDEEVELGTTLNYEITITNNGNDAAVDIVFNDILPINTVFVNDEIMLDGIAVDPAIITTTTVITTDGVSDLSFETEQISFSIDDDKLLIGGEVVITFSVDVVDNCNLLQDVCTNRIQNQADVSYKGLINDLKYDIQSAFDINECGPLDSGPTVILGNIEFCAEEEEQVSKCEDIVALVGGLGFIEYQWYFGTPENAASATLITTNADGTPISSTDNIILVDQEGDYYVDQIKSSDPDYFACRDVVITFEVTDDRDPPESPFLEYGEVLDPACADDGTQIVGIQICNDPIEIITDFADGATYSWQKYDDSLGCEQSTENCPYLSATISNCYAEVSTEASYLLEEEGSYRLTVEISGGCVYDYYFNATPIVLDPELKVTGGGCEDEAVFVVTGVNLTPPTDGVTYELTFDVTNNGTTTTFPPDTGEIDRLTIPRVAGESYLVTAVVTPDIEGSCSFFNETPELVEFFELEVDVEELTSATCHIDYDADDDFDPTVASILVNATDSYPNYLFNLIDTTTGVTVQSSGNLSDNTYIFTGLNPENTYEVEVFASSETDVATAGNCSVTQIVEDLSVPLSFEANAIVLKDLTCEPAEFQVNVNILSLGTTTDPDPELTYIIEGSDDLEGNVYSGSQILYFDDITNEPAAGSEDDDEIIIGDDRVINYLDLSVIQNLTIWVSSPDSANCRLEVPITINPYDPPIISIDSVQNIECEGENNGSILVESSQGGNPILNPSYEIFLDDETTPLATQDNPFFDNLNEGTYTIVVTNSDDCTAEVVQVISEADELVAPVIEAPDYICDGDSATIEITTDATGGTGTYSYELLRNGTLYRTYTTATEIDADTFPEGTYQLTVIDANDCEVVSNEETIDTLEFSLTSTDPVLQCGANPEPEGEVTVTPVFNVPGVVDTVINYELTSTDPSINGTSNTTGIFNLTAGTHQVEATATINGTTATCAATVSFDITAIDEITASADDDFICPAENGQLTFSVADFENDYQYTLESDTGAITPITAATETANPLVFSTLPAGDYTLTVMDNDRLCSAVVNVSIIEQPVLLDPVSDINSTCFDDPVTVTVNPTDGNLTNYEYSFGDDASFPVTPIYQDDNSITFVPTSTSLTYRYLVRSRLTGCTETGTLTITQPEELIFVSGLPTDIICLDDIGGGSGLSEGLYEFELSGGIVGDIYTFTLVDENDLTTPIDVKTITKIAGVNMADIFAPLDSGRYRILVESTSGCDYATVMDDLAFNIAATPNLGDSSTFTVADCTNKVTLFFEIEDGTGSDDGDDFRIAENISPTAVFVDPSADLTDNIFQYGDADFPAGYVLGTFSITNETNRRIFAITDLDFDINGDFAEILDTITGCKYAVEYDTDPSTAFEVTAIPVSAGACDIENSGLVDLVINNISGASTTVDIEIFRAGGDGTLLVPVINATLAAGNNTIPQISGLPVGTLRVRVQDQTNECNATADFIIEIAEMLDQPLFTEVFEDCDDPAMLTNLMGNGGNPPYQFALGTFGDTTTEPAAANFADTIDSTELATYEAVGGDYETQLWIKDLNGCTNSIEVTMPGYEPFVPVASDLEVANICISNEESPTVTITDTSTWEGASPYFYNVPELGNDFIEITSLPFDISLPSEGDYEILFVDSINCPASLNITVPSIDFELDILDNTPLACTSNGVVTVEIITGGIATDIYSFEISQYVDLNGTVTNPNTPGDNGVLAAGDFSEDFTITASGLYTFNVTNTTTQCAFTITEEVAVPDQISIIASDGLLTCNADGSGEAVFEIPGYEGDINYAITNVTTTTLVADGLITNYGDATVVITPTTGTATIDSATGIVTATGFDAGTYNIVLTAGTSGVATCSATQQVLISEPDPLIINIETLEALNCVNTSAIVRADVTGGTEAYTYELFNGTTLIDTNDSGVFAENLEDLDSDPTTATTYIIRVTDINGCSLDSADIPISIPESPVISTNTTQIVCAGESGSFTVIPTYPSGSTDFSTLTYTMYLYDAGAAPDFKGSQVVAAQSSAIINNVFPGQYVIEATDASGCISNSEFPIMPEVDAVEFDSQILTRAVSCADQTEEYELYAAGGSGNYIFQEYTDFITNGGVPTGTASGLIAEGDPYTYTTNNTAETEQFEVYFSIEDELGCTDFFSFIANPAPVPITFEIDYTEEPLCFGEAGGFVDVVTGSVEGGVSDYTYNLYLSTDLTTPLTETTTPAVVKVGQSAFSSLPVGNYVYEVISENSPGVAECRTVESFEILQNPERFLEYIENTGIGCPGDNDAIVKIKIAELVPTSLYTGDEGPYVYIIQKVGEDQLDTVTLDTDTEEAVFTFLGPGDYVYTVNDNGSICNNIITGEFTIEEKESLVVTLNEGLSNAPICKGDTDGTRVYDISGATPPYYYVLLEDPDADEPLAEDIIGDTTYLIAPTNDLLTLSNLAENVPYRLFVFDSGNGLTGDELAACDPYLFEFEFETEDLDQFIVASDPDCVNLGYTVGVTNTNGELNDDDLIIRLFPVEEDGTTGTIEAGVPITDNPLAREEVPAGDYIVYIESLVTGCTTTTEARQTITLEPFTSVQFVTVDVNGVEIQPFIATNEINVYQLQVTGGVNPNGASPYTYEATYVPLESGGIGGVIDVDSNGFFTIEETGYYTFTVIDNYGDDGQTCLDISDSIGINSIDIDVPNVFNPSSSDPLMNTWFPENLTSDFSSGITPIIDPTPDDGISEPEIPGIVTITDAEITGGSITGGTTTGGIVTGGSVTGGSTSTVTGTAVVDTNSGDTITYYSTTGATTDASGVTTGGITITTLTDGTTGEVTVQIIYGGVVTGGTNTGGVITGGVVTGGITEDAVITTSGTTDDTYVITTGGTTTGGTTTGGVTTGGTTTLSNTSTVDGDTSGSVTTGGTTEDAIITGGTTIDGITIEITIPTVGGGVPTVELTTGTTTTGGTATNGTTTDGIVTGGTIDGGVSSGADAIEFLDYEEMQVFVFDRYGRLMKEFKGIQQKGLGEEGWDGTYQNKAMPSGDYWYLIKLNDSEGREFTGHFTLYRR